MGKDVAELTKGCSLDATQIARATFKTVAGMHARFWNDKEFRASQGYMRGARWTREAWEKGQNISVQLWKTDKVQSFFSGGAGASDEQRDKLRSRWGTLHALIDKSLSLSSWTEYEKLAASSPFTLVHGDFHPGFCHITQH